MTTFLPREAACEAQRLALRREAARELAKTLEAQKRAELAEDSDGN